MIIEEAERLSRIEKYRISGYAIDESNVVFFVDEIVPIQSKIPTNIDGREVKIVKSI